jgi:ATP/maltotriose-dependent transcriptional regulator MalT
VLGAKALGLLYQVRWQEARVCAEEAIAVAERVGADLEAAYARITLGLTLAFLGDPDSGERELETARRVAERLGWAEGLVRAKIHLAEALRVRGDYAGALAVSLECADDAKRLGLQNSFGRAMSAIAAEDLFHLGRWDEAATRIGELQRTKLRFTAEFVHHSLLGRLATARGDFEQARPHLARARELSGGDTPVEYLAEVHAACAELALWEGRLQDARDEVAEGVAALGGRGEPLYTPLLYSVGVRAEADAAAVARPRGDDRAVADALATAEERLAQLQAIVDQHASGAAPAIAVAHDALARAELQRLLGKPAASAWRHAAQAAHAAADPYRVAYAQWRSAEALLASPGGRPEAAAVLARARAGAQTLRAVPLQREIDALFRAARLELPAAREPAASPPPTRSAAADLGLTRRELDVLELLEQGCTNREIAGRLFISDRTASVHVSHILAKLNVDSRLRAASVARSLGLLDAPAAPQ